MSDLQPPHYSETVVVPVARPETAQLMLKLGLALVDPDEGQLLALRVITDEENKEVTSEDIDKLEDIIEGLVAEGHQAEIVTQVASSITRGILDGTREHGAETLILGVQTTTDRDVTLGRIVENIVEAAPCDILVYRMSGANQYRRIIVPIDGTHNSLNALNTGVILAKSLGVPLVRYYIQRDYTGSEHEAFITRAVGELDPDMNQHDVIPGNKPGDVILGRLHADDLLVIGFYQKSDLDEQLYNDLNDLLLNRAPGSVLMASRLTTRRRDSFMGILTRRLQRFNPALTPAERNELVWQARKSGMSTIDYLVLILLSAALASLGLLLNSVAVIIGAMLVAPLMSPLGALATGLSTGRSSITTRAAFTLIEGFLLAVVVSLAMGEILFIDVPTPEMLARGTPSLLDAAVALASGLVAAFAIARKEIPSALAGVAIAAALMPPVCTIGLGLALRNTELAGGATLLFFTNIVFIVVSEYLVLLWLGMRPGQQREDAKYIRLWWGIIIGLMAVVVTLLFPLTQAAQRTSRIEDFLSQRLTQVEFLDITSEETDNGLAVLLTIRTQETITPQQVEALQAELSQQYTMPVDFDIATVQIVGARSEQEQQIVSYLEDMPAILRVVALDIQPQDDALLIDAAVRTTGSITPDTIRQIEDDLHKQVGRPIRLRIAPQQVISSDAAAPAEPPSTDTANSAP